MKYENMDSKRGETPLAGVWGCPPSPFFIPPKSGGKGVDKDFFSTLLKKVVASTGFEPVAKGLRFYHSPL